MKDTLREDIRKLIGTKKDNANYVAMAYKTLNFSITVDAKRSFDVILEGEPEAMDYQGNPVVNPELYGKFLEQDRMAEIHHDKVSLFHVRESGTNYPAEVFESLGDVFLWVKN